MIYRSSFTSRSSKADNSTPPHPLRICSDVHLNIHTPPASPVLRQTTFESAAKCSLRACTMPFQPAQPGRRPDNNGQARQRASQWVDFCPFPPDPPGNRLFSGPFRPISPLVGWRPLCVSRLDRLSGPRSAAPGPFPAVQPSSQRSIPSMISSMAFAAIASTIAP